tara:strand:+ start:1622 stop:2113 length:492 start_codon:yes stop_codon:yes gene_type:complete
MKKILIMTSSTSHSKNSMGEEFYCILKLVSGEEIFALVCVDESEEEPILILHNPIKMKPFSNLGALSYIKVTPWMEMTDEDMFVLRMDKVITMTECNDKKLITIYKQWIEEEKDRNGVEVFKPKNKMGKVKLSTDLGYVSSVEQKRESLERLFKEDTKDTKES